MKKHFWVYCIILALVLAFLAGYDKCQSNSAISDNIEEDCKPGVLRIGVEGKLLPFDIDNTMSSFTTQLCDWIYDSLLTFNSQGDPVPSIAEKHEVSEDRLTYTFFIRKNISFHNGASLTAHDVVYSYSRKKASQLSRYRLACINSLCAIDDYTVRFKLRQEEPLILFLAANHEIISSKDTQQTPLPNGTGPFRLIRFDADTGAELQANDKYYLGRPKLDRILVKNYKRQDDVWQALVANKIDMPGHMAVDDPDKVSSIKDICIAKIPNYLMTCLFLILWKNSTTESYVSKYCHLLTSPD